MKKMRKTKSIVQIWVRKAHRRAPVFGVALCLLFLVPLATAADGPTSAPLTRAVQVPTTATLSADWAKLLADPTAGRPEYEFLRERRRWAAMQDKQPAALEKAADELAARQAWYPAVELLWLAEKFNLTGERRAALNRKMKELLAKAEPLERELQLATQLWDAGRREEALARLRTLAAAHPYAEKIHYQLGHYVYQNYLAEEEKQKGLPPGEKRIESFRATYEQFLITLAIDPLYGDAWYGLNEIRALLPDAREFLVRTNALSQRALDFQGKTQPAIERLDAGERSPEGLAQAAEGLEAVGIDTYAILLCQAALSQPGVKKELARDLRARIERLRGTLAAAQR